MNINKSNLLTSTAIIISALLFMLYNEKLPIWKLVLTYGFIDLTISLIYLILSKYKKIELYKDTESLMYSSFFKTLSIYGLSYTLGIIYLTKDLYLGLYILILIESLVIIIYALKDIGDLKNVIKYNINEAEGYINLFNKTPKVKILIKDLSLQIIELQSNDIKINYIYNDINIKIKNKTIDTKIIFNYIKESNKKIDELTKEDKEIIDMLSIN